MALDGVGEMARVTLADRSTRVQGAPRPTDARARRARLSTLSPSLRQAATEPLRSPSCCAGKGPNSPGANIVQSTICITDPQCQRPPGKTRSSQAGHQ
eukprot:5483008-Prymnesium_polylepis.1